MNIGICCRPDRLRRSIDGLAYVEPTVADLLCPREDEGEFERRRRRLASAPLPVEAANCLLPGDLKTTGGDVDLAAVDAYMRSVFDRAAKVGLKVLVYGSGGSRRVPDGFDRTAAADQIVDHLRRWSSPAAAAGVTIALEPLNTSECNIVTSVGEAAELVRRASHPNARLLVDTYHMAKEGEPPEAIRRATGLIAHAHCADGAARAPVGLAGEDHAPYLRAMLDAGYDGRISIEARWDDFDAQLPDAVKALTAQIERARAGP
jgi:sugar phosphate isomerase/epimerase